MTAELANTDCTDRGLTGLATIEQYGQFEALRNLAASLLQDGERVWLGYYYDASSVLMVRGENGGASTSPALQDEGNFVAGGVAPGNNVCIAVGKDGLFIRVLCSETLPYACYQNNGELDTIHTCSVFRTVCGTTSLLDAVVSS